MPPVAELLGDFIWVEAEFLSVSAILGVRLPIRWKPFSSFWDIGFLRRFFWE